MIKYTDEDNFEFKLKGRQYIMDNGFLTIDNIIRISDCYPETYELARAYVLVALGQFQHESLMEKN